MRYRITVRGNGVELRGYLDVRDDVLVEGLNQFAEAMVPFGIVAASPAPEDYNPFGLQQEGGSLGGF